jgi:hypothetical protein
LGELSECHLQSQQHHHLDERDRDQDVDRSIKGHVTSSLAPGVVRDHTSTQRGAELGRPRAALVQVPSVLANDERSAQLDAFAVKRLRINSMLAAAVIRQKSKIKQSRTLRQSIATRVRSIPNSAYVRKLYVLFVFLTNLE